MSDQMVRAVCETAPTTLSPVVRAGLRGLKCKDFMSWLAIFVVIRGTHPCRHQ